MLIKALIHPGTLYIMCVYFDIKFSRYKHMSISRNRVIGEPMKMWTNMSHRSCYAECRNRSSCDLFKLRKTTKTLQYSCLGTKFLQIFRRSAIWKATESLGNIKNDVKPIYRVSTHVHLHKPRLEKKLANDLIVLFTLGKIRHGSLQYRIHYLSIHYPWLVLK